MKRLYPSIESSSKIFVILYGKPLILTILMPIFIFMLLFVDFFAVYLIVVFARDFLI